MIIIVTIVISIIIIILIIISVIIIIRIIIIIFMFICIIIFIFMLIIIISILFIIKNHIYCHFTNIPSKIEIQFLENISLKKNLRLLTTSKYLRNNPNFIYSSYFENYFDLISNARYLFISYFYSFRVSGVFYDYLGTNNPIILSTNNFNFSLFNKFSNNLFTMDSSVFEQYHNIDPV
jgi:hypothetical protein